MANRNRSAKNAHEYRKGYGASKGGAKRLASKLDRLGGRYTISKDNNLVHRLWVFVVELTEDEVNFIVPGKVGPVVTISRDSLYNDIDTVSALSNELTLIEVWVSDHYDFD